VYLPDGVTGSQTDPLRNRTVLLLGFGKLLLGAEGLLALLDDEFVSRLQFATFEEMAGYSQYVQYFEIK
jgi:hypothetical protein